MEPGIEILVFFTGLIVLSAFIIGIYCAFTLERKQWRKKKAKQIQQTVAESVKLYGDIADRIDSHEINVDPLSDQFPFSKLKPSFYSENVEKLKKAKQLKQTVAESAKLYGDITNRIDSHGINVDPLSDQLPFSKLKPSFYSENVGKLKKAMQLKQTVAESAKLYGDITNRIDSHGVNVDPLRDQLALSKQKPNFYSENVGKPKDEYLPKQQEVYARFDTSSNRRYQTPHYLRSKVREKSLSDSSLSPTSQLPKDKLISRSQSTHNLLSDRRQMKSNADFDNIRRNSISGDLRHKTEKETLYWFNKITTPPNYFQQENQPNEAK